MRLSLDEREEISRWLAAGDSLRAITKRLGGLVLEILETLARTHITHDTRTLTVVEPTLTPLQHQLLELLDIPPDAYRAS